MGHRLWEKVRCQHKVSAPSSSSAITHQPSKNLEGTRETLDFDPISIEGCAYDQIRDAVAETVKVIEAIRVSTPEGLESITYPRTA
jgi:ATP-dependent DNA helicase RecG